ncbi:ribokinase [Bacillus timonensis]|uniref:ribokinase n=1 Tax=Bacillus timonensis TaxID=1033734 RepID=UPI000287ED18|nr:ribokinase [Bacillus timonensis]
MSQIVVIGSINMDIVNRVTRHPLPGETMKGLKTEFNPGGKGANQAVSASRAGGEVTMVCALGNDSFSSELLETLKNEGISSDFIVTKPSSSGLAFITVDGNGENSIILEEGANGLLHKDDIKNILPVVSKKADLILLQNEIPWETTTYVLEQADKLGVPVYFNPAPAVQVPNDVLAKLGGLFVNETETEMITGIHVSNPDSAEKAADLLLEKGVKEVIITLGSQGSYFKNNNGVRIFTPAFTVQTIDTTAAGDTFIGAYLVAKSSGSTIEDSLTFATAASALTVSKEGALKSIPTKKEVLEFLKVRV